MEYFYLFLKIFILIKILFCIHYNDFINILKKLIIILTNFVDKKNWNKCKKVYIELPPNSKHILLKDAEDLERIIAPQLKQILKSVSSGSIFLIQNNSDTSSMLMRVGALGRFSHCSILLQPEYLNETNEEPLLFQAAGEKICSKNSGPDIHFFTKFLSEYMVRYPNCRYVFRNLKTPLNKDQSTNLQQFINYSVKNKNHRFCSNFELIWTYSTEKYLRFLIPLINIDKKRITFCSKIVTETYQYIGLLGERNVFSTNPNDFTRSNCNIFSEEVEIIFKM